jgi:hypothetical protein
MQGQVLEERDAMLQTTKAQLKEIKVAHKEQMRSLLQQVIMWCTITSLLHSTLCLT